MLPGAITATAWIAAIVNAPARAGVTPNAGGPLRASARPTAKSEERSAHAGVDRPWRLGTVGDPRVLDRRAGRRAGALPDPSAGGRRFRRAAGHGRPARRRRGCRGRDGRRRGRAGPGRRDAGDRLAATDVPR